jgi:esterase
MEIVNGDLSLHVEDDGPRDAPPVLLLHGITSSTATWNWLVPLLADRYRVLRLDFRGHGRSARAPGQYRSTGYVSDAAAVCEQVAGAPCFVVGHSLGGGTAAALAQRHPALVRATVLEDPPLTMPGERTGGSLMTTFGLMRNSLPRLQESGIPLDKLVEVLAASPGANGVPMGSTLHADAIETMAASLLQLDATVLDPVLQGTIEPAFDPDRPVPVPTLAIAADPASPDCVARPEDLQRLAATSPLAECRTVAGAGHLLHDELANRQRFADAVLEFLAAH